MRLRAGSLQGIRQGRLSASAMLRKLHDWWSESWASIAWVDWATLRLHVGWFCSLNMGRGGHIASQKRRPHVLTGPGYLQPEHVVDIPCQWFTCQRVVDWRESSAGPADRWVCRGWGFRECFRRPDGSLTQSNPMRGDRRRYCHPEHQVLLRECREALRCSPGVELSYLGRDESL